MSTLRAGCLSKWTWEAFSFDFFGYFQSAFEIKKTFIWPSLNRQALPEKKTFQCSFNNGAQGSIAIGETRWVIKYSKC